MNILLLSFSNICSIPSTMAAYINQNTPHHMDVVYQHPHKYQPHVSNDNIYMYNFYNGEFTDTEKNRIQALIDNADVIHYNYIKPRIIKGILNIPRKTLQINHCHGGDVRNYLDGNEFAPSNLPTMVSTPDLLGFVRNNNKIWLPNILNLSAIGRNINNRKLDELTICHSPSNRMTFLDMLNGFNVPTDDAFLKQYGYYKNNYNLKHTDFFVSVCDKYRFAYLLIENKTYETCIHLKSLCHIHFCQMSLGAYGVGTTEALALGLTALCRLSDICSAYYLNASKIPCPIINVCEGNFVDGCVCARSNWSKMTEWNKAWVNDVHGGANVIKKYFEFIESVKRN